METATTKDTKYDEENTEPTQLFNQKELATSNREKTIPAKGKIIVLPEKQQKPKLVTKITRNSKQSSTTIVNEAKNCCQCSYKNSQPKKTWEHFIKNHINARNANKYEHGCCRLCWTFFPDPEALRQHAQGPQSTDNPDYNSIFLHYLCSYCDKTYLSKYSLKMHVTVAHMEPEFICELCCAKFPLKDRLQQHLNIFHYDSKPFQCDYCQKLFRTKINLKKHIVWHTGKSDSSI